MCPTHPVSLLQAIADHPDVPDEIKNDFAPHLKHSLAAQQASKATSDAKKATTDNSKFTFSIYSMHNKADKKAAHDELLWDTAGLKATGADVGRDRCHAALGWAWKLFKDVFKRNSLDRNGIEIVASIHYKQGVGDAQWDSTAQQMFFGDGGIANDDDDDGKRVSDLGTYTIDVVAHEFTHGVVSFEVPGLDPVLRTFPPRMPFDTTTMPAYLADFQEKLMNTAPEKADLYKNMTPSSIDTIYQFARAREAQTLNEHIADCFGIMVKHYSLNQSAQQGSWDLGQGWWTSETMTKNGWDTSMNYQRTFLIPNSTVKQPDAGPKIWDDKTVFLQDPHIYMGIASHAFYLAATKGFQGKTWENVGRIWYDALTDPDFKKAENQTFKGWRDLTVKHAGLLFPKEDGTKKMTAAWHAVNL
jgi:Zn-dependent metalloprotease